MADLTDTQPEEQEVEDPLHSRITAFIESRVRRDSIQVSFCGGPVSLTVRHLNTKGSPKEWDDSLAEVRETLGYLLRTFMKEEEVFAASERKERERLRCCRPSTPS